MKNYQNKKIKYLSGCLCIVVIYATLLVGCQKFVDIRRSSSETLIENLSDCQAILDNYGNMNLNYPSDGEASADDYFLNDAGYLQPTLTDEDRAIYTWNAQAIRLAAQPQWQAPYKVIYHANLVLENVQKLRIGAEVQLANAIQGEALFFRAYSFWQIAQLYAHKYTLNTSGNFPGIPIRLTSDINDISERGTLYDTYNRIVTDLTDAVNLMPSTSIISSRPNKCAAYAMLARVYLSMENYEEAFKNSNLALEINNKLIDYNSVDKNSTTPFVRFNKEVIFHSVMTPIPLLNPGSANRNTAKISNELYQLYELNDLRRAIFYKANTGSNAGSVRFTGNYEPATNSNLFNGITVAEIYLIRSECNVRNSKVSDALNDLNTLLENRYESSTFVPLTISEPGALLARILEERRKELVMRGLRWVDLRRLNEDQRFAKTLQRVVNGTTYLLPPNDIKYTLLIPKEVITTSSLVQNPR